MACFSYELHIIVKRELRILCGSMRTRERSALVEFVVNLRIC